MRNLLFCIAVSLVFIIISINGHGSSNSTPGVDVTLTPAQGDNGKWGYVDDAGRFTITPRYEYAGEFRDDIAVVGFINNKYGYINSKGNLLFMVLFDSAKNFSDELAAVMIDMGETRKWGYIDKKGKFVVFPRFDEAEDFENGKALVMVNNKKVYIDKTGKVLDE
ncbi:MAG: hypothetical protein A2176_03870 [Spirochaetes bacterium RBG_13_51_14]|nr:MAG: hypothetical protein A2176_03870 [Spirochaetes bacterium RBG_13_51_14]